MAKIEKKKTPSVMATEFDVTFLASSPEAKCFKKAWKVDRKTEGMYFLSAGAGKELKRVKASLMGVPRINKDFKGNISYLLNTLEDPTVAEEVLRRFIKADIQQTMTTLKERKEQIKFS